MQSQLERLSGSDGRIFYIERTVDGFEITEACDYHFSVVLTADELRQLGNEIVALADAS
jgi:hypothetical protein